MSEEDDMDKILQQILSRQNFPFTPPDSPDIDENSDMSDMNIGQLGNPNSNDDSSNTNHTESKSRKHQQTGLKQLNQLIGLDSVKKQIKTYLADAKFQKRAKHFNQKTKNTALNIILEGNPGTGKTTVARLIGKILYENGICTKPVFNECSAGDFLSELVGRDSANVDHYIHDSLGGVLFIDEAYELLATGGQNGASESKNDIVAELVRQIENHKGELVVIMAGYTDEMEDLLTYGNSGLRSRFNVKINFPDYTVNQMYKIFKLHAKKAHCRFKVGTLPLIHKKLKKFVPFTIKNKDDGNARTMRNLVEVISQQRNLRNSPKMYQLNQKQINTITKADVKNGFKVAYQNDVVRHGKYKHASSISTK